MGGISLLRKEDIEDHDQREYNKSLRAHQKTATTKTASSVAEG